MLARKDFDFVINHQSVFMLIISVMLTSCTSQPAPIEAAPIEVQQQDKKMFEQQFAQQCVEKETRNSINKDVDRARFSKTCACIAQYMMKGLNAVEAEKFLMQKKSTQSLRIRFERAAYFCIQKRKQPKTADLFKRQ